MPEKLATLVQYLRHDKVILDSDLAALYGVSTKALNQAVKRNIGRFPEDFMFQLTAEEIDALISNNETFSPNRSQIVTGSQKHRDPRYLPYAFTEQCVAMLSSVLRSERAVEVNIAIMRIPLPSRLELVAANQSPERLNPIHIHAYQLVCRQQ